MHKSFFAQAELLIDLLDKLTNKSKTGICWLKKNIS